MRFTVEIFHHVIAIVAEPETHTCSGDPGGFPPGDTFSSTERRDTYDCDDSPPIGFNGKMRGNK